MTDIAGLPETKAPTNDDLPPFLAADQKNEIIAEQHGFLITAVTPRVPTTDPRFNDQVHYTIAFLSDSAVSYMETQYDDDGNPLAKDGKVRTSNGEYVDATRPGWADNAPRWKLTMSWNDLRGPEAVKIAEMLAAGNNFIGPAWFSEIPHKTPGYNPIRVLIGHPQDPPKKKQRQPVAVAASNTSDDGLPF